MSNQNDRFVSVYSEGDSLFSTLGNRRVLVDRETGVTYLFISAGFATCITPLLDAEGKPVITPIPNPGFNG